MYKELKLNLKLIAMNNYLCVEVKPTIGIKVNLVDAKTMDVIVRKNGLGYKFFKSKKEAIEWAEKTQLKNFTKNYEVKIGKNEIYYFIKRVITIIMLCLMVGIADVHAGTPISKPQTETVLTNIKFKDSKGNEYPIYKGARGGYYIIRISKNTGKEYKQYLTAEQKAKLNIK